ncbi:MAG TPA: glutamyl-tRNA reductase [Mycobacteriales bacterium]|nr:glutamyl-tRNA reductase [Mycobacteriales bacterium]
MSALVVGISHHSAPLHLVERASIATADIPKALHELSSGDHVAEALILSTCNRVEVYAHVARFHGGVQELSALLSRVSGLPPEALTEHLYVHYEDRAVQHLFTVASGLDSMVLGEGQILGQLRSALMTAQEQGSVGRLLWQLLPHALRVGKRVRTETEIGRTGASLVDIGVQIVAGSLGSLAGRPVLIIGAGAMGALAGATLKDAGVGEITVANRTPVHADALAAALGGRAIGLDGIEAAIARADVVISSTGASGVVVDSDVVERAVQARDGQPVSFLDLAMPRDIDPAVRRLPGVTLTDLDALRKALEADADGGQDLDGARQIIAAEVATFLGWQRSMKVAPTVVALRAKADAVIEAELGRLLQRVPDLDERQQSEVHAAVRRVVEKLLHAPTVRVKELAEAPGGDHYAEALRELFGLDPQVADAVSMVDLAAADAGSLVDLSAELTEAEDL